MYFEGPQGEVKAGGKQKDQGLGHMPLLESMGKVLCGSWAKAGLVYSNQKQWGLVSSTEDLVYTSRWGRLFITRVLENSIRDLHLLVTLWAVIQGHVLHMGLMPFEDPKACLVQSRYQGSNKMKYLG